MWKIVFMSVFIIIIISSIVIVGILENNSLEKLVVKEKLALCSKVLKESINEEKIKIEEIAEGYRKRDIPIDIDLNKLTVKFNEMIDKNFPNTEVANRIKRNIKFKAIVYDNRFYVTDLNNKDLWSPPYYFTYYHAGTDRLLYLNTHSNKVYYYNSTNNKVYGDIVTDYGMTEQQKNEIIINRLNDFIRMYTTTNETNGIKIKIAKLEDNPYFNALDGVTFFVVYAEGNTRNIFLTTFKTKNYNVVGFTLDKK